MQNTQNNSIDAEIQLSSLNQIETELLDLIDVSSTLRRPRTDSPTRSDQSPTTQR